MIYQDELNYIISEIKKSKGRPYIMTNETLADELYLYLLKEFDEICMVKVDTCQYFVVSTQAKNKLKKMLEKKMDKYRKKASEISTVLEKLN